MRVRERIEIEGGRGKESRQSVHGFIHLIGQKNPQTAG